MTLLIFMRTMKGRQDREQAEGFGPGNLAGQIPGANILT